jgi:hypothetical protein
VRGGEEKGWGFKNFDEERRRVRERTERERERVEDKKCIILFDGMVEWTSLSYFQTLRVIQLFF